MPVGPLLNSAPLGMRRGVAVEDMRRNFVERSPLKRMTTAEDIATLAVYLCSDAAKNLSGQCISVTAGEPAV